MGFPRLSLFIFMPLLFSLSQLHLSSSFIQPQCHRDESSALLQFKKNFFTASVFDDCQKVASWKVEGEESDCCSWNGVECDEGTGHVIGLDLSSSCLFGFMNSNSSLFRLVHLRSLNLAFNDFNYSQIPSQVRDLSRLTHLNLSSSQFSSQIPLEISQLSHLSSLDLSDNNHMDCDEFLSLELRNLGLTSIVENLTRLEKLDLSCVNISSTVPNILANLSSLTVLSLRGCGLYGEFPMGIFKLSNLRVLSVPYNEGLTGYLPGFKWSGPLEALNLQETNFSGELDISGCNFSGNIGFLTELNILGCNFSGSIPSSLGKLINLTSLYLSRNAFVGNIPPSLGSLTKLVDLDLSSNAFWGKIPPSIGNLTKLTSLNLSWNAFVGNIPPSLGNLVQLSSLDISVNQLIGSIPPSLGNLVQLSSLDISVNQLIGSVPFELVNLPQLSSLELSNNLLSGEMHFGLMNETQLDFLDLRENQFTGPITFGPMNVTQLEYLDLSANKLHGQISNSIFNLKNLIFLDLSENYLNGMVEFDKFFRLTYLTQLFISGNQLSLLTEETNANATLRKFYMLGFSSCNLSEFPNFLKNQDMLIYLNLSNNKIHGQVPEWMCNTSSFIVLDLSSNLLQGSLPIPPDSTEGFYISNNSLTGNIPELFCNLRSLLALDLADNNLNGSLPRCMGNYFGAFLYLLDLRRNKFQGSIPEIWIQGDLQIINFSQNKFQGHLPRSLAECAMLRVLDLGDNQFDDIFPSWLKNLSNLEVIVLRSNKFHGHLPRSLAKCTMLKVIDLSDNKFIDIFPFWLENLPNLEVLILRSNQFHDAMGTLETNFKFPNMRILDVSHNNFTGKLPLGLFENWKAKKVENVNQLTYIQVLEIQYSAGFFLKLPLIIYTYSMMMTNKGKNMPYEKVQELFIAIDFSSNKFVGEIPKSIGNLKRAKLLNLSNNALTGHIPSSLGNLTEMEALDLSQNNLSGEIPLELIQLTFLEFFNVSHNNLTGPIPQGKQFDTFENSSFEGNPRLCGRQLSRKCRNSNEPPYQPPTFEESQDFGSPFEFGWKIVVIGYGFGFAVGVIIGQIVIARKRDWLMKTLRMRPVSGRRRRN